MNNVTKLAVSILIIHRLYVRINCVLKIKASAVSFAK